MNRLDSLHSSVRSLFASALIFISVCALNSGAQAQRIQVRDDLDFGQMDIAQLPGTAVMGTNASISYAGGLVGDGLGTVGEIRVTGRSGTTVDISCSTIATLSNGLDTIDITSIELVVGTGTGPGGPGTVLCQGVGMNVIQLTSGNGNPNTALIGGTLVTNGTETGGDYDTSEAGGAAIIIEMVVP